MYTKIYQLIGITPTKIRSEIITDLERSKAQTDTQFTKFSTWKKFFKMTKPLKKNPEEVRREKWKPSLSQENNKPEIEPMEYLQPVHEFDGKYFNRLRTGVVDQNITENETFYKTIPQYLSAVL